MKKKLIALLLCVTMVFSISGCKKDGEDKVEGTEAVVSADIEYDATDYVTLGDYMGMEITLDDDYSVTDEDVKSYIESNVISFYPSYKDTDKEVVESGDFVNIDYVGTQDGEAFSGGTASGYVLEIGGGRFIDGFEDGLIGTKVGEVRELNLTFPEDYDNTELAGADVVFTVTVNKIVEKEDITFDTMTDEYVQSLSAQAGMSYETVDALKDGIRSYLESVAYSSKQNAINTAVLSKLTEICTVEKLPDGLLDAKVAEVLKKYEENYVEEGSTLKDYAESIGQEYEDFLDSVEEEVRADVELQLVLEAIVAKEGIELDEEGYEAYIENLVSSMGMADAAELYTYYGGNEKSGEKYLRKVYTCTIAIQQIMEQAVVTTPQDEPQDTETESN